MSTVRTTTPAIENDEETFRPITAALGEAACSRRGLRLYEGDCLDYLRRLPDALVSLTVTSPPYNIGKEYERPMALDDYLSWCESWMNELLRITKPTGALWLNLGYLQVPGRAKALPIPYLLWQRIPFFIVQEVVWNYSAGVAAKRSFSPRNEKFLWCVKDPANYTFNLDDVRDNNVKYPRQKKNGRLKVNPAGKNPTDVWQIPKVTSGTGRASRERTRHPAQFPVALIDRIVRACSDPNDLVLDPFMGSGSTAEACLMSGRAALGFEISKEYLSISSARIDRWLKVEALRSQQGTLCAIKDDELTLVGLR
jgi:adenine-specific DNA-methyltransferase